MTNSKAWISTVIREARGDRKLDLATNLKICNAVAGEALRREEFVIAAEYTKLAGQLLEEFR